jgi:alpha-2-macroglobulin
MKRFVAIALFLSASVAAHAADKLTILKAGPVGEIATLAEANEIRVVFSEPMIVLGKIPKNLVMPWFHVAPPIVGTYRWSGTTTLIFTPNPKTPLPFATQYDVTIDAEAKAVSGHTLGKPYTFSFITPTIQLKRTNFYRNPDGSVVVGLHFNQPVDAQTIIEHLQLKTSPFEVKTPDIPNPERLSPAELQAFEAKKALALKTAASDGVTILSFVTTEWDRKIIGDPAPELVVLQTKPNVPQGTHMKVYLDSNLARGPQNVKTGRSQEFIIQLPAPLFVVKVSCMAECDPDAAVFLEFTAGVQSQELEKAITVTDITDPAHPAVVQRKTTDRNYEIDWETHHLDEFGYFLQPSRKYEVRIASTLPSTDGFQTLGYTWVAVIDNWHRMAFTSFGDGNGVWESTGGSVLPFYARNFANVVQWMQPIRTDQLVPTLAQLDKANYNVAPPVPSQKRTLRPSPDKTLSYGLDVAPALTNGKGLAWVAVQNGDPIPQSKAEEGSPIHATLVQVTNMGVSVKDSPQNTLIFVTRLDNGAPVAGANVSIRTMDNHVFWSGTTDASGIAIAPRTDIRREKKVKANGEEEEEGENWWQLVSALKFVVIAEKDGDTAYTASNWNEGIQPYEFDTNFNLEEAEPTLRGTIFTDRGVYKPGEEVHAKVLLRTDTPNGIQLLPAGTEVDVRITDSRNQEVDTRTVKLTEWSSSEWTYTIPNEAALGEYSMHASVAKQRLGAYGTFLVAAYRRPEFRVDVTLGAPTSVTGTKLAGKIVGRYLFGAPMSKLPVHWTYSKERLFYVPAAIADRYGDRYEFLQYDREEKQTVSSKDTKLDTGGELKLQLETPTDAGVPYTYTLEGEVTDVSRQKIAGRASFRVDPAPWYIGLKHPPYFADTKTGVDTEILAAGLDGTLVPNVSVSLELTQIQWNSVRRAEGNGFYTWDTERKEVPAGTWTVASQAQPAPLHIPLTRGGEYRLVATATDAAGHKTSTRIDFYAVGEGYTAWERYDHNRIDLVPEKKTYKPGDTARIMVKSPWEHATALLTTEREWVRTSKEFELTSTQQTITVPITENDIPNVFVSVLLVKGRSKEAVTEDASDPGKPSFRLGYTELKVIDAAKRLKVEVKANRDEYRPATKAKIEVNVRDAKGAAARSEVTLWAVDYGVLSLTNYQTPDVIDSVYLEKALQVINDDSRQKIISRRVLTPKGAGEGGGGGRDAGPGMMRRDFRVLAFWVGSLVTDKKGHAQTEITLPESLTTYRIMAVAGDKVSRFGAGQSEIRINKPLLLTQTFPRFLAVGDKAFFGAVVHSQLKQAGTATVTIKSLDPSVIRFDGPLSQQAKVEPQGSAEVRFNATALAIGSARIQVSVSMKGESDAFEDVIPVRILVSPETVAAYGEARPNAKETLEIPSGVVPDFGGLHIDLSSTSMVGLGEGARYLVEYPYGCAEQRSSTLLGLMLIADLGDAFKLPGVDAPHAKQRSQTTVYELNKYQCPDGGFAFWAGECWGESPYLTSWVTHVLQRAKKLKYSVDDKVLEASYNYLDQSLKTKRPENEGWWPAYTAWQAFAVDVLVEGGRNEDSHITRLASYADRMPLFGLAHLADAMIAKGDHGKRLDDIRRRIDNAILPEGGSAHVEEQQDDFLYWLWSSNVRSTAIVMDMMVRGGTDEELVKRMVRWLMAARKDGRWGNTQENAWAMEALVDYYRKYESEVPDFTGVVDIGAKEVAREPFKGRSTVAKTRDVPMGDILRIAPADTQVPVTFTRDGVGTLFYAMRLRYARNIVMHDKLDQGFSVERRYALQNAKASSASSTSFKAGDLIKVTLHVRNTKERRYVAIVDPIPAGTEPVESWFATTASDLAEAQNKEDRGGNDWYAWWLRGGWDHVERHDDRVNLFATRLGEGTHEFSYMLRATTAGTFITAPLHAEEMYEPEVFGRTATDVVEVKP